MAEILDQVTPGPPDAATKRAKFLASFAKLDPDAEMDEASLDGILSDKNQRAEFAKYVNKLNPDFQLSGDELADELKKKDQSAPGSEPSGALTGEPASAMAPGLQPALAPDGLPLGDAEFVEQPPAIPGLQPNLLPDSMMSGDRISPLKAIQQVPGDEYLAAGLPAPSMEELRAQNMPPAEAPEVADDGFWDSLGKSLYNGLDLKRIGGNLLDYGGDLFQMLSNAQMYDDYGNRIRPASELGAPITGDKWSDVTSADLLRQAQAGDLPLSAAAQKSVLSEPSAASFGNLIGGGVASIVPVAAASALGGPLAAAGVGSSLGISSTKDAARAAGIGDEEAAITATILAPIQGVLESFGVKDPGIAKLAVRATLREALAASGGKLTTEALSGAAKRILPEVAKRFAAGAKHEALTEFLQGEAEGAGKLIADQLRGNDKAPAGKGRYGVSAIDALVKSPAEQALAGALLGGGVALSRGSGPATAPAVAPVETLQAAEQPISDIAYDLKRPTGQVEMRNVRVFAVSADQKTAVVRGVDSQGAPIERTVETSQLVETLQSKPTPAPPTPPPPSTITMPGANGSPDFLIDVDAERNPSRLYTSDGREFPLSILESNPQVAQEVAQAIAGQPAADPAIVDVTGQPEPLPPVAEPAALPAEAVPAPAASDEPSPVETPAPVASEPTEQLPAAEPASATPLTAQQQAANSALDALDQYNALDARAKKGKLGSQARAEIARLGQEGGLTMTVAGDGSVSVTRAGKRVTRANEYSGTTPAANPVPITERPEAARPFLERVVAAADGFPAVLQGLGVTMRGKALNAQELSGAVADIKAGKNTMRAQLVLDALENAHRRGYVEKSEGTGMSTRKYSVPVDEYATSASPDAERPGIPLSDPELDELIATDAKVKQAVDDYIRADGSVDYQKLIADERALPFLFDVTEESATKLADYARERLTPAEPIQPAEARVEPGSQTEGPARVTEPSGASIEAGPLTEGRKVEIRAEIDAASQRIKERRAARRAEGRVFSSPLPIGEIDAADLADAYAIAKGHIQLGVLGIQNLITKLREAGLDEAAASDAALKPILRELLTGEPAKALPANEPDGKATRKSMDRLLADDAQPEALKQRVRDTGLDKYEPVSVAETEKAVDDYLTRNSLADAYAESISTSDNLTGDVRTALRVRVLGAINNQLSAALDRGDTATADEYLDQSYKVAEALAKRGTDAGREINAYKLLAVISPEAAVYRVTKDVQAQRQEKEAKIVKKVPKAARAIRQAKAEALENALASKPVKAAREKVAGKGPVSTKERIAEAKAERADLFEQLKKLSTNLGISPQQQAVAELHVAIFKSYIKEGVLRVREMVERFKKEGGAMARGVDDATLVMQATAALGAHKAATGKGVAALNKLVDQIARQHLTDPDATGKSLADKFATETGLPAAEAKALADAIGSEFDRRIAAARQKRLDELTKRAAATPAKRASQADLDKTRELFNLSPTDDAAILDHLKRVTELPELTAQDVADLRKLALAVQAAPEGFQQDAAVEKLLKRQADIKGISWGEIGQAMWYANVLSGYKTHVINFTANVIQTGAELGVNTTYAVLSGKGGYATASGKGLLAGLRRGVREARSVLTTGRETSREPGKYEVPGLLENLNPRNPIGSLKYINRALRAGDVLFSSGLKEMRAYEQAVKFALEDAKSDGTPNQNIWARAAEKLYNTEQRIAEARQQATDEGLTGNDYERRVYEIAEQSRGADIMNEARAYAPRAVFNGEVEGVLGVVSNAIQQATDAVSVKGVKPLKFVIPFVRVITNVANAYLDYTPVGALRAAKGSHFVKEGSAAQREFTTEERQKLLIKSVIGASVMAAAFAASAGDDEPLLEITGAGTGNPRKDAQLRADGWQPYSFKVRGYKTWFSFANAPVGAMLAVVGNANDGQKYRGELLSDDDGALNTVYLAAWRAMQFTKDMTALKSATDFLTALSSRNAVDLTNYGQRLAVGTVKGFVPWSSFLSQTFKDYEMLREEPRKQGRSFGQMLTQDIPVARDGIASAIDALGDPLPVDTDRLFSAPPHREEGTQRIWDWLNKNGLFISVPNRNSGGALVLRAKQGKEDSMTDEEYYAFMKTRGEIIKTLLSANIGKLEKLDPKSAKQQLDDIAEAASEQAKVKTLFPGR